MRRKKRIRACLNRGEVDVREMLEEWGNAWK
jgi:hypothetical protein